MASARGCGSLCPSTSVNRVCVETFDHLTKSTDYESDSDSDNDLVHVIHGRSELPAGTSIGIQNSKNIHFGNNTYVHGGRVVVKQIVKESQPRKYEDKSVETACLIPKRRSKKWKKTTIIKLVIPAVLLIAILIFLLVFFLELPPLAGFQIISNKVWLTEPIKAGKPLSTPVPYVIVCHTYTDQCSDQDSCTFQVATMQASHVNDRKLSDIGYNFLIGGDGEAYEGCGWDTVGVHTTGYNMKSIGVAMIGTFQRIEPPEQQLTALKKLIELGVKLNKIDKNYKLVGQSQLTPAISPGALLLNILKSWDHFSEKP